ncbi:MULTISPECIES: hypothetical protein [Actinomadura]|uniref:Uncharacterized protein n=1 Tax=Actinomadura litoris TaxID=2678616 RepID=A0A7K1KYE6_9ACTN|nr:MULTISPECIES: hypothetical protein [Actinomadura]MBT2209214.1 hypothetical protein [Actinomadura sp. NEAU-AAG7]MUN36976.1 hypothetical protein [Actinomadura litoris]
MSSVARERVRDLQAEAAVARRAGIVRRARAFWEERALVLATRPARRRVAARGPRSAAQGRCVESRGTVQAR